MRNILQSVGTRSPSPTPSLLPIFRSRQQAEILADVLGDPSREESVSDLADRLGLPNGSVHREIVRAEQAGIVETRRVGKTRLVRANDASPYYEPLRELLVRSFGVPKVLSEAIAPVDAYIFGSWAARWEGETGARPIGDVDVLILGEPNRDVLYVQAAEAGRRIGREVQVTIRDADWLENGRESFHSTVTSRPMLRLGLQSSDATTSQARRA